MSAVNFIAHYLYYENVTVTHASLFSSVLSEIIALVIGSLMHLSIQQKLVEHPVSAFGIRDTEKIDNDLYF